MGTFIENFKPTEEMKRKRFMNILDMYKKSLENKTCMTCKHYIVKECVDGHGYQDLESSCKLGHIVVDRPCSDYKFCDFDIRRTHDTEEEETGGK